MHRQCHKTSREKNMMYMSPLDIRYSQDSISCYFDSKCPHSFYLLGETVDEISAGRTSLSSIPKITVVYKFGKWYTADNRRLWVFRQLEKRGKCNKIPVYVGYDIREEKFTTANDGITVRVRGNPWGHRPVGTRAWQMSGNKWTQPQAHERYQYSTPSQYNRQNETGLEAICACCCCILIAVPVAAFVLFSLIL